jgi:outer membrane protein insertion porin family
VRFLPKIFTVITACCTLIWLSAFSQITSGKIVQIEVIGNKSVQPEAIKSVIFSKEGEELSPETIKRDIQNIYKSGFFQSVSINSEVSSNGQGVNGVKLSIFVEEKPSIKEIVFEGFEVITSSSLKDKIQVKKYTIVDERKINADLRLIEQQYLEKGYYLARASYALTKAANSDEVILTYKIIENNIVNVSKINVIGNSHFGENELKSGLATKEKRWTSFLTSGGAFKDDFVNRDKEFLSYIYRDNGFAEAQVQTPQSRLDSGKQSVQVTFSLDEGERFKIGKITFQGDVLFSAEQFNEKLQLKKDNWFRVSQFQNDMKTLSDMYGDEGYAFVDIVPKTVANRETKVLDLEYSIAKGEKIYFRNIVIEGNSKTRDNVIRRNIKVVEGERFHATRLEKSKTSIERLGFFQEVIVEREPDVKNKRMDLRIKVKEKPTGQLSASIGASPTSTGRSFTFFAQGSYQEANLFGKGWSSNVTGSLTPNGSYKLSLGGTEPSIYDGPWSLSLFGSYEKEILKQYKFEKDTTSIIKEAGFSVGREIVEDLRFSLGYSFERVTTNNIPPITAAYKKVGDTERFSQNLNFDKTNNFLQPTSGYALSTSNTFGVTLLGGDHKFGLWEGSAAYYVPVTFSEDFLTNFRLAFEPAFVYPIAGKRVPYWERLRLGSPLNMRAYYEEENIISPKVDILFSPESSETRKIDTGGNRRLYGSVEYFVPLIQEANLRFVAFAESGTVLADNESFRTEDLKHDVGFGFRWLTPIAPFRFEWAFPINKRKIGEGVFVLFVGNDNASSLSR